LLDSGACFKRIELDVELAVIQVRDVMVKPLERLEHRYDHKALTLINILQPKLTSKFASVDRFISRDILGNAISDIKQAAKVQLEDIIHQVRDTREFFEGARRKIVGNLDPLGKCSAQFLPTAYLLLNKTYNDIQFCGYNETMYFETLVYHVINDATLELLDQLRKVIYSVTNCFDIANCTGDSNNTNSVNCSQLACKFDDCVQEQVFILKPGPVMDIRNYPKSFDFLAWV
jgi:hypothetical protein